MLFIISLGLFTVILTIFENIFLALIAGVLLSATIFIIKIIKKSKFNIWKKVGIIALAFVISLVSIFVKNYTYDQKVKTLSNSTGLIYENLDGPQGSYFVGTGIISDIYSYQKYVFQDNAGREYFLRSDKKYEIGDIVRLNGYVSIGYTGSKNIFDIRQQLDIFSHKQDFSNLFHYEFNYPKWEMMKGFYGTIYEQNSIKMDDIVYDISFTQKIRKFLQNSIVSAYGESRYAGLVLGMLIGDRSQITTDDYQGFVDSGLVHIIAVSGGNIIMIVVFLSTILFFLPFYTRNAVILLTIIGYAMVCGLDSSVFRATIMGGLSLLALFRGREINIWRAMGTAFIVMVIFNPYFLTYDVGFLLSFSAIIGIVFFSNFVEKYLPKVDKKEQNSIRKKSKEFGQKVLKEYMTPTIGATLGVLPIMLFFMGGTNLLGIIANFFVTPIIAIVMIYGFISTILYGIIPRNLWLWPEKILIDYIYLISNITVKRGLYINAVGDRVKWILLILFFIRFLMKVTKLEDK